MIGTGKKGAVLTGTRGTGHLKGIGTDIGIGTETGRGMEIGAIGTGTMIDLGDHTTIETAIGLETVIGIDDGMTDRETIDHLLPDPVPTMAAATVIASPPRPALAHDPAPLPAPLLAVQKNYPSTKNILPVWDPSHPAEIR